MSTHIKITNKTRGSFRRGGIRFPNGSVVMALNTLTDEQLEAIDDEPRLTIKNADAPKGEGSGEKDPKKAPQKEPKKEVPPAAKQQTPKEPSPPKDKKP